MGKTINLNTYYYKKSEIDDLLSRKANLTHTHGNITNDGFITNQKSKNVVTDENGKIITEAKPTIPVANATATNIKMDGTQSAGSLSSFARADHVHPVDTSRAAASHNHDDKYFPKAQSIQVSSSNPKDLNDFNTTGFYYCNHDVNEAQYISNTPVIGKSFWLLVEDWGTDTNDGYTNYTKQTITFYTDGSKDGRTFIRIKNQGTWKPWREISYIDTLEKSINIGHGTLGGTTSAYTVSITGVTLTHGTIIALYNPIGNNSANATLNVNSLGAKPIYYQAGAIPLARFPSKTIGLFMYNTSIVSTGCWQMIYSFNSDTYNRLYQTTQVIPGENVSQYGLVWGKFDDKYYLIKSGATYDIRHPILWASTALVNGTANVNLDQQYTSVNLQNTVSNKTVTAHRKVYVKGTLNNGQFTVHSDVFVSNDNLTDGFYYIPIGTSYSTYQIRFSSLDMTVYKYTTARGLIPVEHSLERYDGNYISGNASPTKPYLRLFNLKARNGSSSSSHIIFEIIGNNNDRLYAKIRVDMRQNTSTTDSSYTVTPLEVYGFNLDELYFGFRDDYPNTSLDIFRKVGAYVNFFIRYADDHTRDGTVTMYSPVVNSTESYTDLNEASASLYNANYTNTSQGGTYAETTNTIPYTNINANKFVKRNGNSNQFLKADGSVDSNTYLTTSSASSTYLNKTDASNTYQPKGNYLTSHQSITGKADKTGGVAQVTDANANNYSNIGSLSSGATQQAINNAINTKIGAINTDVSILKSIKAIEVVATKPTASASTMNKLYIVSENNKVNVYYTSQSESTYSWHKMDTDILDELSIAWNDITGKPAIDTTVANNANNLVTSQAVYNGLNGKAPTSHASTGTGYGVGTTTNYGHVKVVQNLTTNDGNGLALGAGQGKVLKELIEQGINDVEHITLSISSTLMNNWSSYGIIKAMQRDGYSNINEFVNNIVENSGISADDNKIISFESPYNSDNFIFLHCSNNVQQSCILCNPEIQYKEATITYDNDTTETVYLMTL